MTAAHDPDVSVVIPTFNRAAMLVRALDSVAAQTWGGTIECVVVDNASTDTTPTVLEDWTRRNPGIRVVSRRWPENIGPVPNWCRGIELARSEWIKVLWSDDWLEPNAIGELMDCASRERVRTVTCGGMRHTPDGAKITSYCGGDGAIAPEDVVSARLHLSPRDLPVSPTAGLIQKDAALAGLHIASRLGHCYQRAIGPDLIMLYYDVFSGSPGEHLGRPLVNFWGGNPLGEDPSITATSRRSERRTCYDAALWELSQSLNVAIDARSLSLLRHRSAESRLARQPGAEFLPPPRLSLRGAVATLSELVRPVTRSLRARKITHRGPDHG